MCVCFFFKQKTAYEMRISYWSSDVCSSDLVVDVLADDADRIGLGRARQRHRPRLRLRPQQDDFVLGVGDAELEGDRRDHALRGQQVEDVTQIVAVDAPARSEEHTSELQSLMRISYAVFCLKKKKKTTIH